MSRGTFACLFPKCVWCCIWCSICCLCRDTFWQSNCLIPAQLHYQRSGKVREQGICWDQTCGESQVSSGMLWGPSELERDEELYIATVTGCDNSYLRRKMERDGIGRSMLLEIRIFRCELGLFYIFINVVCWCCAWITWFMGLCCGGLQRGWLEMVFGALFIYPWICLRWILSLCKFKDLLSSPPHLHPQKSHFIRKQAARWFWFIFIIFFFKDRKSVV